MCWIVEIVEVVVGGFPIILDRKGKILCHRLFAFNINIKLFRQLTDFRNLLYGHSSSWIFVRFLLISNNPKERLPRYVPLYTDPKEPAPTSSSNLSCSNGMVPAFLVSGIPSLSSMFTFCHGCSDLCPPHRHAFLSWHSDIRPTGFQKGSRACVFASFASCCSR